MDMLNMTTDTELSVEYLEDMQALMDKYSEMLEKETDWVKLVDKEMFNQFYHFKGVGVGVQGRFIVRADMNICIMKWASVTVSGLKLACSSPVPAAAPWICWTNILRSSSMLWAKLALKPACA